RSTPTVVDRLEVRAENFVAAILGADGYPTDLQPSKYRAMCGHIIAPAQEGIALAHPSRYPEMRITTSWRLPGDGHPRLHPYCSAICLSSSVIQSPKRFVCPCRSKSHPVVPSGAANGTWRSHWRLRMRCGLSAGPGSSSGPAKIFLGHRQD